MALDLFRVSSGLQIDESSQILEGSVVPSLDAPVGSLYTLTTNGTLYTKITAGTGTDKWSALGSGGYIDAAVAAEATIRANADTTLQNNINTEITVRLAADNAEATIRANADTTLQNNINTEITIRTNADTTLQNNINAEITARTNADTALNDRIDALGNAFNYIGVLAGGATAGTATDLTALPAGGKDAGDYYKVTTAGYFNDGATTFYKNVGDGLVWNTSGTVDSIDNTNSEVQAGSNITVTGTSDTGFTVSVDSAFATIVTNTQTGLAAEITARTAADLVEVTARTAADTTLQNNINTEITARAAADLVEVTIRAAADTTLQANINAEATIRANADTTLQANINAEITARTAADLVEVTARTAAINAEATIRANADTTLQANINAEATIRANADTTLQSNLTILNTFVQRDGKVTTADAVQVLADTVDVPVSAVQWIVHVQNVANTAKVSAYEVFAASNGVDVDFSRYALLKLSGGVTGVAITATLNGANGIDLSVTTPTDANIKIKRVAVV